MQKKTFAKGKHVKEDSGKRKTCTDNVEIDSKNNKRQEEPKSDNENQYETIRVNKSQIRVNSGHEESLRANKNQ